MFQAVKHRLGVNLCVFLTLPCFSQYTLTANTYHSYPTQWTTTKPHQDLLKDFREKQVSETAELMESTNETNEPTVTEESVEQNLVKENQENMTEIEPKNNSKLPRSRRGGRRGQTELALVDIN